VSIVSFFQAELLRMKYEPEKLDRDCGAGKEPSSSNWTVDWAHIGCSVRPVFDGACFRQTESGSISGTVRDMSGAVIRGVTVAAR
jgi:hypothetical protein